MSPSETTSALKNIMDPNITYCLTSTTVLEVAQAMREDNVGAVLVLSNGEPQGFITDRDIVMRCILDRLDPRLTTAAHVMSEGVECVRWDQDVYDVAEIMKNAQVRRVAVVDEGGNAVGVVSFDDVFDLLSEELANLREAVHPRSRKLAA